jgi:hypothetical protein
VIIDAGMHMAQVEKVTRHVSRMRYLRFCSGGERSNREPGFGYSDDPCRGSSRPQTVVARFAIQRGFELQAGIFDGCFGSTLQ